MLELLNQMDGFDARGDVKAGFCVLSALPSLRHSDLCRPSMSLACHALNGAYPYSLWVAVDALLGIPDVALRVALCILE